MVIEVQNICRFLVEDIEGLEDASYIEYRKKLIDHYIYSSVNNLVEWT